MQQAVSMPCISPRNACTYTDVTVHHEADAEEAVKERIVAGAGGEGSDSQRQEASRKKAFKRPVVGSMGLGRWREGGRVVHGPSVNG